MLILEKSLLISSANRFEEHSPKVIEMIEAICSNSDFKLVESRIFELEDKEIEILIVDVKCTSIKSRNSVGIFNRERLAILYSEKFHDSFRVSPIRENFPENVLHTNFPTEEIPKTLCLYFESWKDIERNWTPQNFLMRICWWLIETSTGTLHSDTQELERPYFASPLQLLLPDSIQELKSSNDYCFYFDNESNVIRICLDYRLANCSILILELDPINHTRVFPTPQNLKELEEQFLKRSSSVINVLRQQILLKITPNGTPINDINKSTFILLKFNRFDTLGKLIESPDMFAFYIHESIGTLGMKLGALVKSPTDSSNYFINHNFGKEICQTQADDITLNEIRLLPVEVVNPLTREFASRMSGISLGDGSFIGILIGAGSLGSTLAEIWSKSSWGNWIIFDGDQIKPHNIFRHIAKEKDIGRNKAELVGELMNQNFSPGKSFALHQSEDFNLDKSLEDVDLIVDASASLHLLRDISRSDHVARGCTLFFNQTGIGGVLFLEDKKRSKKLDLLELNYFRALINEEWGDGFLETDIEKQRVGSSCSDISVVLSYEKVLLLSSSLSSLLRMKVKESDSSLVILKINEESGGIDSYSIELFDQKTVVIGVWSIVYNTFVERKLFSLRSKHLPNETGGIVIGYIDQKTKTIYIVDITEAPEDSKSTASGFVRGTKGLNEYIQRIKIRTANNCGYIGDWHSHPVGNSSEASHTDLSSLNEFSEIMKTEGLPILMVIVGEDIGFNIK
ncbi:hypothetical protein LPTSP2_38770 [Leptospira ellinghausenii]|uniref:ThiF family protein n=1 Tax=Leptospira ellinghausenii TaxID=1917822 RepID=A0A2P2DIY7_9LEPT|nr:ThiF family adenylyltransferase [Leptospira ellinghausenii]GBF44574.1 hypothetical protein LPTSP2_38770 [Leptospira ellinghausenii]